MAEERAFLKAELAQRRGNLHKLRMQAATFAEGDVPLRLLNQIEAEEKAIAEIKDKLERKSKEEKPETEPRPHGCRIELVVTIMVAITGLIGVLGAPVVTEWAKSLFAKPTPIPTATEMITIPEGWSTMGSNDSNPDEKPQHEAYVKVFQIDTYEVTNGEYKKFIDATKHRVPYVDTEWARPYNWDPDKHSYPALRECHPVVLVSWDDANAYCQWAGKRLPTETEWEKAARGTGGRRYPWGNEWNSSKANTLEGGRGETAPVGMYPEGASPYGVMDMAGNVWEWTEDWYEPYPGSDYWTDLFGKKRRVVRGGSWNESGEFDKSDRAGHREYVDFGHASVTFRLGVIPGDRYANVGFRCAKSVQ